MIAAHTVCRTLAAWDIRQALNYPTVDLMATAMDPSALTIAQNEAIEEHAETYKEIGPAVVDAIWPDTATLVPPRDPAGREVDPVMDVLQLCATPWVIRDIWLGLREVGFVIGTNMEAETAVAMHWLIGHALRRGPNWREAAITELQRLKAEKEKT